MILKPLYFEALRHLYRFATNSQYRKWCLLDAKLRNKKRFKMCKARVNGWDLTIPDSASFLSSYSEIFVDNIYKFESHDAEPRILDLGANIGLSILFFKKLYPNSTITGFEPDPNIFKCLKNNVHGNGFDDVNLINKAVWINDTVLNFSSDGADGGHVVSAKSKNVIDVKAVNITKVLSENEFDFLKMDIEGAEDDVFPACKEYLPGFKHIFIEYHSIINEEQNLSTILKVLKDSGFRVHLNSIMSSNSPFIKLRTQAGFDNQLNIFAWRDNKSSK